MLDSPCILPNLREKVTEGQGLQGYPLTSSVVGPLCIAEYLNNLIGFISADVSRQTIKFTK